MTMGEQFNPRSRTLGLPRGVTPAYYECGCCGAMHPALWDGDCRDDDARLDIGDIEARHGDTWQEIDMQDVDGWRAHNKIKR